jgi:hypothetical protein
VAVLAGVCLVRPQSPADDEELIAFKRVTQNYLDLLPNHATATDAERDEAWAMAERI